MTFKMPDPLPLPVITHDVEGRETRNDVRATGFSGDITRYPLTRAAYLQRCKFNGLDPTKPPNAAWYYAPNPWVQNDLDVKGRAAGYDIS